MSTLHILKFLECVVCWCNYRPQGKVILSEASVSHFVQVGGGESVSGGGLVIKESCH